MIGKLISNSTKTHNFIYIINRVVHGLEEGGGVGNPYVRPWEENFINLKCLQEYRGSAGPP